MEGFLFSLSICYLSAVLFVLLRIGVKIRMEVKKKKGASLGFNTSLSSTRKRRREVKGGKGGKTG